jgi:hypothetical protein
MLFEHCCEEFESYVQISIYSSNSENKRYVFVEEMEDESYESLSSSSVLKSYFIDFLGDKDVGRNTHHHEYDEDLDDLEEQFSKSTHMKFLSNEPVYDSYEEDSWEGSER